MPTCQVCLNESSGGPAKTTPGLRLGEECDRCGRTASEEHDQLYDEVVGVLPDRSYEPDGSGTPSSSSSSSGTTAEEGLPWPSTPKAPRASVEPEELLAVDFDGTLTEGRAKYWNGEVEEPREPIVEWVREQYFNGAHIVVWTARPWSQANVIAARLTEWSVPYHGIRCEKGGADSYLDDRAARPEEVLGVDHEEVADG